MADRTDRDRCAHTGVAIPECGCHHCCKALHALHGAGGRCEHLTPGSLPPHPMWRSSDDDEPLDPGAHR